jgi:hypothetical protein
MPTDNPSAESFRQHLEIASILSRGHARWCGARGVAPLPIVRGPSVYVGGPAYRRVLGVGHAVTVAQMASSAATNGVTCWISYGSSSSLANQRCVFLSHAIQGSADVAVTIDADCSVLDDQDGRPGGDILLSLAQRMADLDGPVGVALPIADGKVNAKPAPLPPDWYRLKRCEWVGTGIMIFPLRWYRDVYAHRVDPDRAFAFAPHGESHTAAERRERWKRHPPPVQLGEDVWHCDTVTQAGGTVRLVCVPGAAHEPRPNHGYTLHDLEAAAADDALSETRYPRFRVEAHP